MNIKKTKEKLLQDLSVDPVNKEHLNIILTSFSTRVELMEKQNNMLIKILQRVKRSMDSTDYSEDFDSLYDEISTVLKEVG